MALTFVRTGELREAVWHEFDLDAAEWRIPGERMKTKHPHLVPLSRQALEVVRQLKEINGSYRFVFPGRNPRVPMSKNTVLFALYRMGYRGRMTGHGFRAVASTLLNEMNFNPDVIERQLAHREKNAVRAAYHRSEYREERRRMMQVWADYLMSLTNGGKVIPIRCGLSAKLIKQSTDGLYFKYEVEGHQDIKRIEIAGPEPGENGWEVFTPSPNRLVQIMYRKEFESLHEAVDYSNEILGSRRIPD